MSIVTIIRDIVEALPVTDSPETFPHFIHGEKDYQNLLAEESDLTEVDTIVFLDEPITSNDRPRQGGLIEEEYPLSMLFVKKSELEYTPEQHQAIIVEMRALRRRFLSRLQSNTNIRRLLPDAVSTIDVINVFDTNLTGVILRFTIVPFSEYTACP